MTRYLIQIAIAPQAMAAVIQNPHNRAEAVRPIFEAVGGRLEEYYIAVGGNTAYIVAELPDEKSLGVINMAVFAGGAVTSMKSTAIVTAEEAVDVMKKAGAIAYRPPGG